MSEPMEIISDAIKHGHNISVCKSCAEMAGGKFPPGHVAATRQGECRACEFMRPLLFLSDWDFPSSPGARRLQEMR